MTVVHEQDRQRFIRELPEGTAELTYERDASGAMDIYHTFVPPAARNNGIAASLVEAAIAFARETGVRIVPSCPYVRDYLSRHPEATDLVWRPGRE